MQEDEHRKDLNQKQEQVKMKERRKEQVQKLIKEEYQEQ